MRLIEDATFETLTRYEFESREVAWSLSSGTLGEDPTTYYLVGTATEDEGAGEPNSVRAHAWVQGSGVKASWWCVGNRAPGLDAGCLVV